ncbi:low-affinity phosphate transporter [Cladochytrium tenue]|nr:low-affinity phosphate transporter [Cladochytrium tenue]
MKFSHAIELNANADWLDYYIAYSNLKKWVYLLEKAKLGLIRMPSSRLEVDPSSFSPAMADRPSMGDGEEQRPLLHAQSDGIGGQQATDGAIMAFFAEALDEQLDKVVEFYVSKEKELFAEVEELELEVADFVEAQNPGRGLEAPHQTDGALAVLVEDGADAPLVAEPLGSPRAGSPARDGRRSGSPLRRQGLTARRSSTLSTSSSILTIESTTAAAPLAPYHGTRGGGSWKIAPDAKVWVRWLRRRLTTCFVTLSELEDYRELNRNGFAKILKKFDKVTGLALRDGYMSGRVEQARPFTGEVGEALRTRADRVVELYARVAAGGDMAVATRELVARLRDHVAIERNTVWRDMVERERRTASVVVRPRAEAARAAAAPRRTLRIGKAVVRLPSLPPPRALAFLVLSALFAWAVAVPLFEPVEQQYCLAILVFASALWAFEILPLFVTSLTIPALVVLLQVMCEDVHLPDGSVEHRRLGAKAAAKRVFSDMFGGVIVLLLGGFSLASALSKHSIAKGIASIVLGLAGSRPRYILLANIVISTFLSMWISNVAAPAVCFSLIAPILRNLPSRSPYAKALITGIALAANVGGMASPIASPQNIVAIGILNDLRLPVSWPQWFAAALPVCLLIDLGLWVILLALFKPDEHGIQSSGGNSSGSSDGTAVAAAGGGGAAGESVFATSDDRAMAQRGPRAGGGLGIVGSGLSTTATASAALPAGLTSVVPPQQASLRRFFLRHPFTWRQVLVVGVLVATVVLWCVESSIEDSVGDMGVIALLPIVAFYGTGVLSKDDWNSQLWSVVALAMGGIVLGKAVDSSGLLANLVGRVTPGLAALPPLGVLLALTGAVVVAASFISHTVAALIVLPVVASIGAALPDPQPRLLVLCVALTCSGAMALPVSSFPNMNAVSQEDPATGEPWVGVGDLVAAGAPATLLAWVCIVAVAPQAMLAMGLK